MKARNRAVEREPEVGEASRSIIKQTTAVLPIRTDAFASDEIDCVTQPRYAVRRHWSDADFHITQAPLSDIFQSWGLFDSFGTIGARSHGTNPQKRLDAVAHHETG